MRRRRTRAQLAKQPGQLPPKPQRGVRTEREQRLKDSMSLRRRLFSAHSDAHGSTDQTGVLLRSWIVENRREYANRRRSVDGFKSPHGWPFRPRIVRLDNPNQIVSVPGVRRLLDQRDRSRAHRGLGDGSTSGPGTGRGLAPSAERESRAP